MDQKQQQAGNANDLTRREFVRDGAVAAAGVAVGLRTQVVKPQR